MLSNVIAAIDEPQFAERWFGGTYIVSGTFILEGRDITPARISEDIDPLYRETARSKRARWPRGLTGFFIIPIYCAPSFGEEVLACVRTRLPFRWAIWPEPMLYDTSRNAVTSREDFGLHGAAFRPYLNHLFETGLTRAATLFGHKSVVSIGQ